MTRMTTAIALALALACSMNALAQQPAGSPKASTTVASSAAPINLNSATAMQLETLPGVGAATAQRILEYRQKNGGFKKVEDLMNIRGVGEKSFLKIKPLVTVSAPRTERASQ
jgi:comEA protein